MFIPRNRYTIPENEMSVPRIQTFARNKVKISGNWRPVIGRRRKYVSLTQETCRMEIR